MPYIENLEEILKLDISNNTKEEFKEKLNKRIYFKWIRGTKVGTLIGIDYNNYRCYNYLIKTSDGDICCVDSDSSISLV